MAPAGGKPRQHPQKGDSVNIERDKFLTEAMGECWHEPEPIFDGDQETSCFNIDFSTWEGFGKLWEWAWKQDFWGRFVDEWPCYCEFFGQMLAERINPDRFADSLYSFLKDKSCTQ